MYPFAPQHLLPRRRIGASPRRGFSVLLAATTVVLTAVPSAATATPAAAGAPAVSTGQLIPLTSLGGPGSFAMAMNERGDLIGASVDAADNYRAVVWWRGQRSPTALGIDGARPTAINEKGHIVGVVDGGLFLWRDRAATYLRPRTAASFTTAFINDRDQVASTATADLDGASRAVLWHRGRLTMLPTPGGMASRALGINNRGQIIGTIIRPGGTEQAVLWQHGRMTTLGTLGGAGSTPVAINDRGQVTGNSTVAGSSDEHPFLWQRGRMTDLLAGTNATAGRVAALNATGTMTGTASFGDRRSRPVLWRAGRMIDIGLSGHVAHVSDINDRGDVAGRTWADPQTNSVPFRWRGGHTTLFPEPVADIAFTIVGIDRRGTLGVDQETSLSGNTVLRSA
ncbi:MAG TPA: hypothetical protein VES42_20655 [Pilimelia sp.]|nr:hypothetical protein [Pilimelia sp.]